MRPLIVPGRTLAIDGSVTTAAVAAVTLWSYLPPDQSSTVVGVDLFVSAWRGSSSAAIWDSIGTPWPLGVRRNGAALVDAYGAGVPAFSVCGAAGVITSVAWDISTSTLKLIITPGSIASTVWQVSGRAIVLP